MFVIFWLLIIVRGNNCLFVKVGDYPQLLHSDVNLPRCGMRQVPMVVNYPTNKTCYLKPLPNQTLVIRSKEFSSETRVEPINRIFNGRDAMVGESPWTVRLEIVSMLTDGWFGSSIFKTRCSGSLITFEWILTAAHCFKSNKSLKIEAVNVWAGSQNWKNSINLKKIIKLTGYETANTENERLTKDIALIKTKWKYGQEHYDFRFYHLNTICLPTNESALNSNYEHATFSGWGVIDIKQTNPKRLQIAETVVLPNNHCKSGLLCAFQSFDKPRACVGDSGGPLFQFSDEEIPRAILIGVLQGGKPGICGPGTGSTDWNPPMRFIPWLLDTMSNN